MEGSKGNSPKAFEARRPVNRVRSFEISLRLNKGQERQSDLDEKEGKKKLTLRKAGLVDIGCLFTKGRKCNEPGP